MNEIQTPHIIGKNVKFFSLKDQYVFIEWIKKLDAIDSYEINNNKVTLEIAADDLHDHDLKDLIALLYRYKIDMTQLAVFLTKTNKKWFFNNKIAYWHKAVFKNNKKIDNKKTNK